MNKHEKLIAENARLKDELDAANKSHALSCEINETYIGTVRRQGNANHRLIRALDATVDKLLRQTIAQKSHRERNIELCELCRDILQIMDIAHDEYPFEDIPF